MRSAHRLRHNSPSPRPTSSLLNLSVRRQSGLVRRGDSQNDEATPAGSDVPRPPRCGRADRRGELLTSGVTEHAPARCIHRLQRDRAEEGRGERRVLGLHTFERRITHSPECREPPRIQRRGTQSSSPAQSTESHTPPSGSSESSESSKSSKSSGCESGRTVFHAWRLPVSMDRCSQAGSPTQYPRRLSTLRRVSDPSLKSVESHPLPVSSPLLGSVMLTGRGCRTRRHGSREGRPLSPPGCTPRPPT